jgi:iron(III) transport system substrate-binding protein
VIEKPEIPSHRRKPVSRWSTFLDSGFRRNDGIRSHGIKWQLGAGIALALYAAGAPAQAPLAAYEGADRMQRIAAEAKKEGSLTLYTSIAATDLPTLIPPFEKKYGIKVNVWRASTTSVLQRTVTEAAARRYEVDAIHISGPEMEALNREQLLQPVVSPSYRNLLPGAVPKHRGWAATLLTVFVQAYNINAVKKQDLPKSFADLLDPKWKGKLGIESEDQDWFATVVTSMGEEKGLGLFREIARRNGVSVRTGHTLLNNMVVAGDVPLALTVYNYMPESAKQKGAPIDWFALDPVVARSNAIGVARRAPRPNAALLFHEYMLNEAQDLLVGMNYVPTNTGVASPLKDLSIKLIDPNLMLDQRDKWSKAYEGIFGRRAQ